MKAHGIETFTIDFNESLEPDLCCDIREVWQLPYCPDILWASPPCQWFSVAVIGRNWNRDYTPKTPSAELAIELVKKTLDLIRETKPKIWFIENPRWMLRKMPFMEEFIREGGGATIYNFLLSVLRYKTEANGYMDECDLVGTKTDLFQVSFLPRISTTMIENRNTMNKRCKR